jgi:hypothetical protein
MRKMKITTTTRVGKLSWSMNARMKSHDLTRTMLFQGQYTPVGARDRMWQVSAGKPGPADSAQCQRVDIIRKRAEHLGTVEATTEKEAIEKAGERFEIPPERRNRITVQKVGKHKD